jgi:hypothetical protein
MCVPIPTRTRPGNCVFVSWALARTEGVVECIGSNEEEHSEMASNLYTGFNTWCDSPVSVDFLESTTIHHALPTWL